MTTTKKKHKTLGVLFDVIMIVLTGGLWFIWIVVRFLRAHS